MKASHLLLAASLLGGCATAEPGGPRNEEPGQHGPEAPALTEAQAAHLRAMVEGFVTSQAYPGLAIGVIMGSELVWEAGFGAGANAGEPPDATTLFRAGSVTKLVTATALLELSEAGALSLDDEAATWLPELEPVLSPEGRPAVTLRHLISHASGLPRNGNGSLDWTRPDAEITEADLLAALDGVELSFDPGSRHEYSNIGAALAGVVIARASGGQGYRSFVQEHVLEPLAMRDSVWDVPGEGLAPGHWPSSRGGYEPAGGTWRMGAMEPAGGLFTTVGDAARLAVHGLGHASVLEADALAASLTEVNDVPGPTGYGLGWLVTEVPEVGTVAWHNGSTSDYGAFLGILPERDVGVVILLGTGMYGDMPEIESLGMATLAYLVDPKTDVVPQRSTTPPAALGAVGERLLALTSAPTADLVDEAFDASFFASVPRPQALAFFEEIAAGLGGCSAWETSEDRGLGSFLLRLDCARGDLAVDALAQTAAPYRMSAILIRPVE